MSISSSMSNLRLNKMTCALLVSAMTMSVTTGCTLFGGNEVLAGRVLELQGDSALISVHSTAKARPGQQVGVYRVDLQPAVKHTAPPWRQPAKTGTAVIEEVVGEHAVRVRMTAGTISTDHDVELRR